MDSDEQTLFDELIRDSRFDDTICEAQKNALRVKVFQAFDESRRDMAVVEPVVIAEWSAKRVMSIAAAVTVCLLGTATIWFSDSGDSSNGTRTEHHIDTRVIIDAMLVASLAEVNALRDEASSGAFFRALAMCQQGHESRLLDSETTTMEWYYESSFPRPADSPKG